MTLPALPAPSTGRRPAWRQARLLPFLVLAVSLGISYWLWDNAQQNVERDRQIAFDVRVREISASIEQGMKSQEQILRGIGGWFSHDDKLDRDGFRRYVAQLRLPENFPGVQGIGFSQLVADGEKERHISALRMSGFADYAIKPEGRRDVYSPIIHSEPLAGGNIQSLGLDPYASPISRPAMERARDLNKPIISRMTRLTHDAGNAAQAGFMMYLPVFGRAAAYQSFAERRASIAGWAYTSFRMADLLDDMLDGRTDDIAIQIYDSEEIGRETLIYEANGNIAERLANPGPLKTTRHLGIGGHTWTLVISSRPGFAAQIDRGKPQFIAKAMLGGSFLLALLSWLLVHGRMRAVRDAEKLAAAEAGYRSMFDNALDAVFLLRGRFFVDCNTTAETLFGCRREQIVGQTPLHFSPSMQPGGRASKEQAKCIEDRLDAGEQCFEWLFQRFDGSLFFCDVALRRMSIGGETLYLANVHDISERKNAEEEIRRISSEREAILQNTLVGICLVAERRHLWVNKKFAEMIGYQPEELIGQSTRLHYADETSWQAIGDLAYPAIRRGQSFSTDWQMKRKDGSLFWAQLLGKPVDDQDSSKESIWTYLDITQRKQAEEETRATLAQQKELNQLKSRFVSMTSHEFRTPLTTIMSSAELLKNYNDRMPAEERAEVIASIEKAVRRMTRMLEDILTIGQVDAGKIEFRPESMSLREFCEDLVNEIPLLLEEAGRSKCRIDLQIVGDGGEVCLDEKLLHHIFGNLLSNAIKYSPAGGTVFFGVVCRPRGIEFTVADQGIGLPDGEVEHLFKTFYRASNVDSISGTGLGLAIVKRAVELHGGSIKVDSVLGSGTRFVVSLPTLAG